MKIRNLLLGLFVGVVSLSIVGCGKSEERSSVSSDNAGRQFFVLREMQLQEKSRAQNIAIPPEYTAVLQAVTSNDLPTASNAIAIIKKSIKESGGVSGASVRPLWQDTLEIYGAFEQFSSWTPDLIEMYGRDVLRVITSNGIFFGGTDSGRFVITAFQETTRQPFYVVSQNPLMDKRYIAYLRGRIGTSIWLPEQADLDKAAEQYPDGPKGITQVMQINGALAKMIFDRNKAGHEFWVEVSYVIPWMFPFLQPDGLVMKLNSEPTELTSEMVDADRRFWDAYVEKLITHPDYARDASAQATFSKLRCSIAVLLVARGQTSAAEYAYNQAVRLSPASPEAALGLAELYAKEGRWVEAIARAEEFKKLNPEKASFADVSVASFKKRQAAAEQNGIRSVAP